MDSSFAYCKITKAYCLRCDRNFVKNRARPGGEACLVSLLTHSPSCNPLRVSLANDTSHYRPAHALRLLIIYTLCVNNSVAYGWYNNYCPYETIALFDYMCYNMQIMSELAQAYYQERADRYGIENVPGLLNGEPIQLFAEDHYVPLHTPESSRNPIPASLLKNSLEKIGGFVLSCAPRDEEFPHYSYGVSATNSIAATEQYAERLLIPRKAKTGRLLGVELEAVTHEEIPEPILAKLRNSAYPGVERDGLLENTEAYLKLTGELRAGGRRAIVGAIYMPRAVQTLKWAQRGDTVTSIHYASAPLRTNHLMGRSLVGDSRATHRIVTGHNMSRAITSPNGNNRRQDGR